MPFHIHRGIYVLSHSLVLKYVGQSSAPITDLWDISNSESVITRQSGCSCVVVPVNMLTSNLYQWLCCHALDCVADGAGNKRTSTLGCQTSTKTFKV